MCVRCLVNHRVTELLLVSLLKGSGPGSTRRLEVWPAPRKPQGRPSSDACGGGLSASERPESSSGDYGQKEVLR
ncbi:hypothetical protein O3P69_002913 [Scylla paramamosain]|uniref:Uncharacterized protein n=1 Tax=Scylla paramamosain TaxID=85552 RepID=A0AAW0UK61_SCYPA